MTELERYMSLPQEEAIEPLQWWKINARKFPVIATMARESLAVQASSVPSEKSFSSGVLSIEAALIRQRSELA